MGLLRHICEGQRGSQGLCLLLSRSEIGFCRSPWPYRLQTEKADRAPAASLPPPCRQPIPSPTVSQPRSCKALPRHGSCQPRAVTRTCHTASGTTAAERPCGTLAASLVPSPSRLCLQPQRRRASSRVPLVPGDLSGCWSLPCHALSSTACSQKWSREEDVAAQTALT